MTAADRHAPPPLGVDRGKTVEDELNRGEFIRASGYNWIVAAMVTIGDMVRFFGSTIFELCFELPRA